MPNIKTKVKITVGADPEVFVMKDGQFISAHGLIKGTKAKPFPVNFGAVQVDGTALEFNIDPAHNSKEFVDNVLNVLQQLVQMVPDYDVTITPVAKFEKIYFDALPYKAYVLGCEPDFNAWTGEQNKIDETKEFEPMRTAAGHVHIGWATKEEHLENPEHIERCRKVIRQCDFLLGLPSLLFDTDTERRGLYGRAGAHRIKTYGTEYRVLSNQWLKSPQLIEWIYKNTQLAIDWLWNDKMLCNEYGNIETIINESNAKEALKIIEHAQIPVPAL